MVKDYRSMHTDELIAEIRREQSAESESQPSATSASAAVTELCRRFLSELTEFVRRKYPDVTATHCANEAFEKVLLKGMGQQFITDRDRLRRALWTNVKRRALDRRRNRRRHGRYKPFSQGEFHEDSIVDGRRPASEINQVSELIDGAMATLDDFERRLIHLYYFNEESTYRSVAAELQMAESTVRNRINRILEKWRYDLGEENAPA